MPLRKIVAYCELKFYTGWCDGTKSCHCPLLDSLFSRTKQVSLAFILSDALPIGPIRPSPFFLHRGAALEGLCTTRDGPDLTH